LIVKELKTDEKGRISLTKEDRINIGDVNQVIMRREGERVILCPVDEWTNLVGERLLGLKGLEWRRAKRALFSSCFLQRVDKQGRVLIPSILRKGGGINGRLK
jgi:DNA-binding transcriptional regulator/RsmH inhibitor MraZ